ncbi:hypothetical protein [Fusobacterium sp. PH5-44]|uniref:hypothetical protein n=1 Tax=unclassified Fusobacterium TaxID=2648384 RepID=UPI003D1BD950
MIRIIITCICLFKFMFGYSNYNELLKNDEKIILSFVKIPVKNGFQHFSYRFPFDEYHITSLGKLLQIKYYPKVRWKGFLGYRNNGYFEKRNVTLFLNDELNNKIKEFLTPYNKMEIVKNYVKINESNIGVFPVLGEMALREDVRRLNKKLVSYNKKEISFILDKEENGKLVSFDMLYNICLKKGDNEILLLLGSNSDVYENKETKEFIKLLNEILKSTE